MGRLPEIGISSLILPIGKKFGLPERQSRASLAG
jgi:hypothetical protein